MLPTEELKVEHQAVLNVLDILQKISDRIRTGQGVNIKHLDELLEILKEFVDRSHHGKEEKILFDALEKLGFSREAGPVGVMLAEHDNGRQYIQGMRDAVGLAKSGESDGLKKFAVNASYYSSLMVDHIYKEDNILYPMADMHLSIEDKSTMMDEFKKLEEDAIGIAKKESYLKQIDELKKIY